MDRPNPFQSQDYPLFPKDLVVPPPTVDDLNRLARGKEEHQNEAPSKLRRKRGRGGRPAAGSKLHNYVQSVDGKRLRRAAERGDIKEVKSLLQEGMDTNCPDSKQRTPLHLAAVAGHLKIVEMLISWGADVNAKDCNGNTPLHLASCSRHLSVMTILLRGGADVRSPDMNGRLAIHYAQSRLKMLTSTEAHTAQVMEVIDLLKAFMMGIGDEESGAEVERLGCMATDDDKLDEILQGLSVLALGHTGL